MNLSRLLRHDLIGLGVLTTLALAIGFTVNLLRDQPMPLVYATQADRLEQAVAKIKSEASTAPGTLSQLPAEMDLGAFQAFVENNQGVILDARPEIFHRLGHIPGAHSLPREDFATAYEKMKSLLATNKQQPIAIYCSSSSCEDSHLLANALRSLGYQNVTVFTGGWAAWTGAGLPEESDS